MSAVMMSITQLSQSCGEALNCMLGICHGFFNSTVELQLFVTAYFSLLPFIFPSFAVSHHITHANQQFQMLLLSFALKALCSQFLQLCRRCVTSLVLFITQPICVYAQHHAACT